MKIYLILSIGSILGSCSRLFLQNFFSTSILHIWSVNLLGSFLAGICFASLQYYSPNEKMIHTFLMTGFLGSFTTFSAFSLIALQLLQSSFLKGGIFIFSQIFLGILFFYVGIILCKSYICWHIRYF